MEDESRDIVYNIIKSKNGNVTSTKIWMRNKEVIDKTWFAFYNKINLAQPIPMRDLVSIYFSLSKDLAGKYFNFKDVVTVNGYAIPCIQPIIYIISQRKVWTNMPHVQVPIQTLNETKEEKMARLEACEKKDNEIDQRLDGMSRRLRILLGWYIEWSMYPNDVIHFGDGEFMDAILDIDNPPRPLPGSMRYEALTFMEFVGMVIAFPKATFNHPDKWNLKSNLPQFST